VEESHYTHPRLRQVFDLIERDEITPQERARMKDEYGYEQLRQEKYQEGLAVGKYAEKIAIAQNLLTTNLDIFTIAQVTGLPESEIEKLRGI
jgi:predicted transposase/invertase (TIGR01784 family)